MNGRNQRARKPDYSLTALPSEDQGWPPLDDEAFSDTEAFRRLVSPPSEAPGSRLPALPIRYVCPDCDQQVLGDVKLDAACGYCGDPLEQDALEGDVVDARLRRRFACPACGVEVGGAADLDVICAPCEQSVIPRGEARRRLRSEA